MREVLENRVIDKSDKRLFLLIMVMLFPLIVLSQKVDTISFHYKSAKYKFTQAHKKALSKLIAQIEVGEIDSIRIIGTTDEVGSMSNNMKLSLRRANNCYQYLKSVFPLESYSVIGLGEARSSRRVDVLIYTKPFVQQIETELITDEKFCYEIDYNLLQHSFLHRYKRRRKQFVRLVTDESFFDESKRYFSGYIDSEGKWRRVALKWKHKSFGKRWWRDKRFVLEMPETYFDQFKVFTTSSLPCNDCASQFDSVLIDPVDCIRPHYMLMRNTQYNFPLFNPKIVRIRVPKELVSEDLELFKDCKGKALMQLKQKKSRRHRAYLYAKLRLSYVDYLPFVHALYFKTSCCYNDTSLVGCNKRIGLINCFPPIQKLSVNPELGHLVFDSYQQPYIALNMQRHIGYNLVGGGVGIDLNKMPIFYGRAQVKLATLWLENLNPLNRWKQPSDKPLSKNYLMLYAGSQLQSVFEDESILLGQNLHVGFKTIGLNNWWVNSFFIQSGLNYEYLQTHSFSPFLQVGVNFKFLYFK